MLKIIWFPYFLFIWFFNHNFIIYIDFSYIASSNTATDYATDYVTHRVFNTNI